MIVKGSIYMYQYVAHINYGAYMYLQQDFKHKAYITLS